MLAQNDTYKQSYPWFVIDVEPQRPPAEIEDATVGTLVKDAATYVLVQIMECTVDTIITQRSFRTFEFFTNCKNHRGTLQIEDS